MNWLDSPTSVAVVDSCEVHYRRIGRRGAPPILLLHGGGGHAGWWVDVVPQLTNRYDVIVPELSGHGRSGHRSAYRPATWAAEILAVLRREDIEPAHVIGHSMGGMVGLHLAGTSPEVVRSLVLVDSAVTRKEPPSDRSQEVRFYPTSTDALAHFRLRPRGTIAPAERLAAVARAGIHETEQGWRWRFDPNALHFFSRDELESVARRVRCPVGFVFGGMSELTDVHTVDGLDEWLGYDVVRLEIPDAYHHVPLDAPARTVAGVEELLVHFASGVGGTHTV